MNPSDIIRSDQLADLVCHEEQMEIWETDLLWELAEFLEIPREMDEMLRLRKLANRAIRSVVVSAFAHPEILGIPSRKARS